MKSTKKLVAIITIAIALAGVGIWFQSQGSSKQSTKSNITSHRMAELEIPPKGDRLKVHLALTQPEQTKGLSGTKPEQFGMDQGMLFAYPRAQQLAIWMPDTYFNLDVFFLDEKLRVVGLERDVAHHPGYQEPPPIARSGMYRGQFFLEIDSKSPLAKKIDIGTVLLWKGDVPLADVIKSKKY